MEAVTEALAQEVKDFGIKVTASEPGMFKTDWIGRSLRRVEPAISDYDALRKRHDETPLPWNGDLAKAAQAMLTIIAAEDPPGHVLLGSIAEIRFNLIRQLRGWKAVWYPSFGGAAVRQSSRSAMARYARGRQHFVFKPRFSNLKISEWSMTDRPEAVEDYNILQLSGDIIGLGDTEAVIAGHDWGRRPPGFVHCCDLTSSEPLF